MTFSQTQPFPITRKSQDLQKDIQKLSQDIETQRLIPVEKSIGEIVAGIR